MSKVFIVTGAAQGIGAAAVKKLIEKQHFVIGIDLNSEPQAWEVFQKLSPSEQQKYSSTLGHSFRLLAL